MNENIFHGRSLEECISNACNSLKISSDNINYEIIEKRGILKKRITIKVLNEIKGELNNDIKLESYKEDTKINEEVKNNDLDGFLEIKNGKLIIEDPKAGGNPATLLIPPNLDVTVNGQTGKGTIEVTSESDVKVNFPKQTAKRNLNITISENDMKAYISINYLPEQSYCLKDCEKNKKIIISTEVKNIQYPPKFNREEIIKELEKVSVKYGIIEGAFSDEELSKDKEYILIAQGIESVDDEEDSVKIKFNIDKKKFKEDEKGNVDYKNIGAVDMIEKGELIGELIQGKVGKDGKTVKGKVVPCKKRKKIIFKSGNGCEQIGNLIYSTTGGKPAFKGGIFQVNPVYEVNENVDIATGNIQYSGDVDINGEVKDGMEIKIGGNLKISQNTTYAHVLAQGNIEIEGNVISSQIYAGGENNSILRYVKLIQALKEQLQGLIESMIEVKKFGIVSENNKDGEVIKALIESKFKKIPRLCVELIKNEYINDELKTLIITKLMYLAPLNIKHFNEIDDIIKCITLEIEEYSGKIAIPSYVTIDYCQDSIVRSTGDIYIVGKGQYVSDISCNGIVEFKREDAISRGGNITAKHEVRVQEVGSIAGVSTRLKVEKYGHIYAKKAYGNTTFVIGNKEHNLDCESNNVHVYMDSFGEVVVDRIKA